MRNYDENILRARRIQPSAPFPAAHQAVRIALFDEYAARGFYARLLEAYGGRAPSAALLRSHEKHVETLARLCARLGVARPLDSISQQLVLAPSWRGNCERAFVGEIARIRLFDALLAQTAQAQVRKALRALQWETVQSHLPMLRQAARDAQATEQYHAARGISPQQAYEQHGPVSDLLEKMLTQLAQSAGPLGVFSALLRRVQPAMLAGVAAGGAGVVALKSRRGA